MGIQSMYKYSVDLSVDTQAKQENQNPCKITIKIWRRINTQKIGNYQYNHRNVLAIRIFIIIFRYLIIE